jgi:hypothetical protein
LFYPSLNGRFSLGAAPVAYFSQDFDVNCCEVIEQFRSNEALHFDELRAYLQGDVSVEDDWFGYPTSIRVKPAALVADLSSVDNPLLNEIHAGRDPGSVRQFYEETVIAWNPDAKRQNTSYRSCDCTSWIRRDSLPVSEGTKRCCTPKRESGFIFE